MSTQSHAAMGRELALVPLPRPLRLKPFRTMLRSGIPLAFSSDYPAAGLSPWEAVSAAVTRLDATGRAILPDESIDLVAALERRPGSPRTSCDRARGARWSRASRPT
jgi:hypothetical protein